MTMDAAVMDRDLEEARALLDGVQLAGAPLSVDRCRHASVTLTALWVFRQEPGRAREQIGNINRDAEPGERTIDQAHWTATQMHHSQPTGRKGCRTLSEACAYVLTRR